MTENNKSLDVFGIENALLDIIIKVEDKTLQTYDLHKGKMHLVSPGVQTEILKEMKKSEIQLIPAGSCTNTIMGLANLGMKVGFCGKVGSDEHGDFYELELNKDGIKTKIAKENHTITGKVVSLVTHDGERTFAVNIGAAIKLKKNEIPEQEIANSKILYITAYTLEDESMRESVLHAIDIAKKSRTLVAIDLADEHLIKRILPVLKEIVEKHVDILFLNEKEALAFTEKDKNVGEAIKELEKLSKLVIIKLGEKGSVILHKNKVYKIPCQYFKPVDTTGAGDLYASGFLYGYLKELPLKKCGEIGAFVASKIVIQDGARLKTPIKEDVEKFMAIDSA